MGNPFGHALAAYWHARALVHFERRALKKAESCCRRALRWAPGHAKTLGTLGAVLHWQERREEAVACYRAALAGDPGLAQVSFNLGVLLLEQGDAAAAVEHLRRAVQLDARHAQWHAALGTACHELNRPVEALPSLEAALRLDPDSVPAHEELAACLLNLGEAEAALASYARALELDPSPRSTWSNMLFALNYTEQPADEILRRHVRWAEQCARGLEASASARARERDGKLRIGLVSGDFRVHSVAYFLEALLAEHDRARFELVCYSDVAKEDAVTARHRQMADLWRAVSALSDEQLADQVRADAVDVLVDLAGHSAGGRRILLFARRAAPIQVSWLGYPNTTGLQTMDYRLTDIHADPPGQTERYHTEKLVRLAAGFLCYAPPGESPLPAAVPLLKSSRVTFGSFNNLSKLTHRMVVAWCKLLRALPQSRLVLKAYGLGSPGVRERLAARFGRHGVDPTRIDLRPAVTALTDHLTQYAEIDIALDTYPYHGTTTTCEALWMGVPVVSLAGPTHVSRVGVSLLRRAGLAELIAETPDDYVRKALELARAPARLQDLRRSMRGHLLASPLLDRVGFTRCLEEALSDMRARDA